MVTRRMLMAGSLGLIATGVLAQQMRPGPGGPMRAPMRRGPPPPVAFSGGPAALELLAGFDQPVVQATLAGQTVRLAIDTGAMGYARIDKGVAQRLNLAMAGTMMMSDPSGRAPTSVESFVVPDLQLGTLRFASITAEEALRVPGGVDGVLGLDLFQNLILTFDRVANRVTVAAGRLSDADGKTRFASPPGPVMRLPLTVGRQSVVADIDTGQAVLPLLLPSDSVPKLKWKGAARAAGVGRTVSQSQTLQARTLAVPVRAGAVVLPIAEAGWPSPHPVANLGWKGLAGLRVALDRTNGIIELAKG